MVGLPGHSLKTGLGRHVEASSQVRTVVPPSPVLPPPLWQVVDRLSAEQIESAIAAYQAGSGARALAAELGLSKSGVLDLLRARDVPIRPRTRLSDADVVEATRLYESGLYLRQVAERFGVSTECVRKRLVNAGVRMRPDHGGRPKRKR